MFKNQDSTQKNKSSIEHKDRATRKIGSNEAELNRITRKK